jgi:hypothetical protein
MNVQQLIRLLEDCDPDAEAQLATQSHYPLRYHLAGLYVEDADNHPLLDVDHPDYHQPETGSWENVVWLVEGSQHYEAPYSVPENAWAEAVRP